MSAAEIVEQLKTLSDNELQTVIQEAGRIRWEVASARGIFDPDDDPILRMAGSLSGDPISSDEIDRIVYGDPRK